MGMSLVINTSLDAVTNVDSEFGCTSLQSVVDAHVSFEGISAEVSVVGKVGELVGQVTGHESGSLFLAVVLAVTTSSLNPFGKSSNVIGKTLGRIVGASCGDVGNGLLLGGHHVSGTSGESSGSGDHTVVHATIGLLLRAESTDGSRCYDVGLSGGDASDVPESVEFLH